jgi:hypothetical protein
MVGSLFQPQCAQPPPKLVRSPKRGCPSPRTYDECNPFEQWILVDLYMIAEDLVMRRYGRILQFTKKGDIRTFNRRSDGAKSGKSKSERKKTCRNNITLETDWSGLGRVQAMHWRCLGPHKVSAFEVRRLINSSSI